jgi:single-strand DNA-binding protein
MARSFNQVILMGNLTRDPELKAIPSGQSVVSFSLALNRSYKDQQSGEWKEATDYVDVTAWGPLAERIAQYCQKGKQVLVNGRIQSRSWEQDGQKRTKVEVLAQDVTFLGAKDGGGNTGGDEGGGYDQSSAPQTKSKDVVIEDISDEPIDLSEIPF